MFTHSLSYSKGRIETTHFQPFLQDGLKLLISYFILQDRLKYSSPILPTGRIETVHFLSCSARRIETTHLLSSSTGRIETTHLLFSYTEWIMLTHLLFSRTDWNYSSLRIESTYVSILFTVRIRLSL